MKTFVDESSSSVESGSHRSDEESRLACFRVEIHTAPLITSLFGICVCLLFTAFYATNREYILVFPLAALFANHFLVLLGNRLRSPKLYAFFTYTIKFLITIMSAGMLFYIYVVLGDKKREVGDLWLAFHAEWVRVSVAIALIAFVILHRWFLQVVKMDYASMQYERFVQRTATIYSLMSEVQSRDEQHKLSPYALTTVLIKPLLEEV